jgi:hypothetical protein
MNKKIITTLAILFFNLSAINVAYAVKTEELNFGNSAGVTIANYIGEVKKGKAHGIGALKAVDGTHFIGKFKRNIIHGEGILIKLDPNDVLADLKINDNFPQLNKNQIQSALAFREKWVNLKEIDTQVKQGETLLQLKVKRQNLKTEFFETIYPEWWTGVLKKANNDEKLLLDEIQIFVGKWKYGTFNEYLDKGKKFKRKTKLKKLNKLGEDLGKNKVRKVNGLIPEVTGFNINIKKWDVTNVYPGLNIENIDGTIRVTNMPIGGGLLFTGEVDKNNIPVGNGKITERNGDKQGPVLFTGNFGPGGIVKIANNDSEANLKVKFEVTKNGPRLKNIDVVGQVVIEGTKFVEGTFTVTFEEGKVTPTGNGIWVDENGTREGKFTNEDGVQTFIGTQTTEDGGTFVGTIIDGVPFDGEYTSQKGEVAKVINGKADVPGLTLVQRPPEVNSLIEDCDIMVRVNQKYYSAEVVSLQGTELDPFEPISELDPVELSFIATTISNLNNKDNSQSPSNTETRRLIEESIKISKEGLSEMTEDKEKSIQAASRGGNDGGNDGGSGGGGQGGSS